MTEKWRSLVLCDMFLHLSALHLAPTILIFFSLFPSVCVKREVSLCSSSRYARGTVVSEWELSCPHILLLILLHPTYRCIFIISLDSVSLFITRMLQFFILHWQLATGNAGSYFVHPSEAHSFPNITMFCLLYFVLGVVECHPWKDVHWASIE